MSQHEFDPQDDPTYRSKRIDYFIGKWQPRLGLQAWDIRYNPDRKIGKDLAANSSNQNYMRLSEIGIQPNCPDSQLENNVLHELLHLVTGSLYARASSMAGALGDSRTAPVFIDELHDLEETMIEQLCFALTGVRPIVFGKRAMKHWPTFKAAA